MDARHIYIYGETDAAKTARLKQELERVNHSSQGYTWYGGEAWHMGSPTGGLFEKIGIIVHVLEVPEWVKMGTLVSALVEQTKLLKMDLDQLPKPVRNWMDTYRWAKSNEWFNSLLSKSTEMSLVELRAWLDIIPDGFCRAQILFRNRIRNESWPN